MLFGRSVRIISWLTLTTCWIGCGWRGVDQPQRAGKSSVSTDVADSRDLYAKAAASFEEGDHDTAAKTLMELLIRQPDHGPAKLLAARVEAGRGQPERALQLAESITTADPGLRVDAARLRVQLAKRIGDPVGQEKALRILVAAVPQDESYARQLWKLFHRQGRTFEAAVMADLLSRRGKAPLDALESLLFRGQSHPRRLVSGASPSEHFDVGLGTARWHFTQKELDEASQQLQSGFEAEALSAPAMALYGRLLAETQQVEQFAKWYAVCTPEVQQYDDYWSALGVHFVNERQHIAAIGVLLQAVVRNPVDSVNYQRLALSLDAVGQRRQARVCREHGIKIRKTQNLLDNSDLKTQLAGTATVMAELLVELRRPFEALEWSRTALPDDERRHRVALAAKREELAGMQDLDEMLRDSALLGLDPSNFDFQKALAGLREAGGPPRMARSLVKRGRATSRDAETEVVLQDISRTLDLDFQWFQANEEQPDSIALYQSLGGGIGVIDFDLDGRPDLYFAQGSSQPPSVDATLPVSTASNQLFRNSSVRFDNVTQASGTIVREYSQGIAVGDVNQDGFPDLMIGNIGKNRLLINCGDGTFSDSSHRLDPIDTITSSVAIGDVDADNLPDLFEVNYIRWKGAFEPIELDDDGHEVIRGPLSHSAQADRWLRSDGDGSFTGQPIPPQTAPVGTGLGIVVTDLDGQHGNEVFIGNDARPNHLLVRSGGSFKNVADVLGVANGYFGSATACMGIASGDFDRDGRIDLHVTNFLDEYDNLFLQSPSGVFRDVAPGFQLHRISSSHLGFGNKAIDLDRDGWLDLVVANGHISDLRHKGKPFRMRPVCLRNGVDGFFVESIDEPSKYWEGEYLGRAIASLDWDQDGQIDFVVTHLDRPAALLHNRTDSRGSSVQFELVGTTSERDAIGARVSIETSHGVYRHWVTAGDGYLCSDESVIDFGLGQASRIDRVIVHWPSGVEQVFDSVATGRRYLVIEGDGEPYPRDRSQTWASD